MQANYGAASSSRLSKDSEDSRFFKRGNSAPLTAGLLIADVVGAGVLAMGRAVAQLGWMVAIPAILLMLAMNAHIMILVWRVQKVHPAAKSYKELACMTMERAQPDFLNLAKRVVVVGQYTFIFATLSLYTLSIGQGLGMFFYDLHSCLPMVTFIGCMLLLPMNTSAKFLGSFSGSVVFNCLCTCGTVLIPILWMMHEGVELTRPTHAEFVGVASQLSVSSLVTSVSTFGFAFSGQFLLCEIMSEMDDIEEFPKAYLIYSLPFQAASFLGVGLSTYYFRGSAALGMIVQEIPFGFVERLAASCLVGHILITYVIKSVVLSKGLLEEFEKSKIIANGDTWLSWYLMAARLQSLWHLTCINASKFGPLAMILAKMVLIVGASWFMAQIVPFFADFVSLLGATLTPLIAFIVPLLLYGLCISMNDVKASVLEKAVMALELLVSCIVLVYGTASTLVNIVQKWDQYGYPFACHCQSLWRTCSCSPNRMECPA